MSDGTEHSGVDDGRDTSRRDLIRKVAVGTAVAWTAPIVLSTASPAAAASGPPVSCAPCTTLGSTPSTPSILGSIPLSPAPSTVAQVTLFISTAPCLRVDVFLAPGTCASGAGSIGCAVADGSGVAQVVVPVAAATTSTFYARAVDAAAQASACSAPYFFTNP